VNAPEPTWSTRRQRTLNPQVSGSNPEGRTINDQVNGVEAFHKLEDGLVVDPLAIARKGDTIVGEAGSERPRRRRTLGSATEPFKDGRDSVTSACPGSSSAGASLIAMADTPSMAPSPRVDVWAVLNADIREW